MKSLLLISITQMKIFTNFAMAKKPFVVVGDTRYGLACDDIEMGLLVLDYSELQLDDGTVDLDSQAASSL